MLLRVNLLSFVGYESSFSALSLFSSPIAILSDFQRHVSNINNRFIEIANALFHFAIHNPFIMYKFFQLCSLSLFPRVLLQKVLWGQRGTGQSGTPLEILNELNEDVQGRECLYCREQYNEPWIQCNSCKDWTHQSCAGFDRDDGDEIHICVHCTA
jgi:hypothetical protein